MGIDLTIVCEYFDGHNWHYVDTSHISPLRDEGESGRVKILFSDWPRGDLRNNFEESFKRVIYSFDYKRIADECYLINQFSMIYIGESYNLVYLKDINHYQLKNGIYKQLVDYTLTLNSNVRFILGYA